LGMDGKTFKCTAAFDINRHAVAVYNKNLSGVARVRDLLLPLDVSATTPDIVLSGSPCQGFSTAGKREINDPRNGLFLRAIDIAIELMPKVFVAENVYGILSGTHKTEYMDIAINRLQHAGYKTHLSVVDCRSLGMAQMRKRALLFAWNTQNDLVLSDLELKYVSLEEAIANIPPNTYNHNISTCQATGICKIIAKNIQPGQKLSNVRGGKRAVHTWDIPEVYGDISQNERTVLETLMKARRQIRNRNWGDADPVSIKNLCSYLDFDPTRYIESLQKKGYIRNKDETKLDLANTFNGKFRRLRWDEPAVTVDTRFGSPMLFLHPTEHRAFTVREAARVQGFPDNFIFDGPLHAQYEMVGNAVPPPLSIYIASLIKQLCRNA